MTWYFFNLFDKDMVIDLWVSLQFHCYSEQVKKKKKDDKYETAKAS